MATKCTECGAAIKDDSRFCSYCGAKLPEEKKEDKKRREFSFEINHGRGSVRRAEIEKEREAQRFEFIKEQQRKRDESMKNYIKLFLGLGIFVLIMIIINSIRGG